MDKDAVQKANKVFQDTLAAYGGGKEKQPMEALAIDLGGGNLCDQAPKIVTSLIRTIKTFSWFIPDNVEGPALAFLTAARDVILPAFCGAATVAPKPTTKDNISNNG